MAAEPPDTPDDAFRRRALAEAARYGSDPLVFVRELLQNARDAGARRVEIATSREGALERVACRDDGCGMTREHARRYLFALYASSKEGARGEAGKFGIGFWSVLRFAPTAITVRSWAGGDAWQVTVDGTLERVVTSRPAAPGGGLEAGTEVVLERPAADGRDLPREVLEAARHYGRYLTLRDDPDRPLEVRVDGQAIHAELALPAPSAAFRGRGFRGVVGLAARPEVELFAQGLFVRSASSLQELRDAGELAEGDGGRDALAELPSLAPRVLIDSAELDLMLARSDARYDKHLRRILSAAEKALGRLITRHLQALRPQPWTRLLWGRLRDAVEPHLAAWKGRGRHLAVAALAGLALGSAAAWRLIPAGLGAARADRPEPAHERETSTRPRDDARPEDDLAILSATMAGVAGRAPENAPAGGRPAAGRPPLPRSVATLPFHRYADLASDYRGPRPETLAGGRSRLAMVYRPAETLPLFTALVIDDLAGSRWAASPPGADEPTPYRTAECRRGCIEVQLLVAEDQRALRLPIPAGHRLDAASVRLDGRPTAVFETASGEAVLRLQGPPGSVLEYRTGPAPPPARRSASPPAPVPGELAALAEELRGRPVAERVQAALAAVARRVRYDRSPGVARSYQRAVRAGAGFVEAALDLGAGDCDVQNGVLATLLRAAGVDARLAVGYVGIGGTVAPGLHAWVVYAADAGRWDVADASTGAGAGGFGTDVILAAQPAPATAGGGLAAGVAAALTPGSASARPALAAAALVAVALAAVALVAVALAAVLAAAIAVRRRRTAAALAAGALTPGEDLAALLGGALRHPEAFAGLPALFHGRFVPLAGRSGGLSLARARRLARANRLFRTRTGSRLARRAAARGVEVVDASTAEGRVLSLALGAIDLDRWSSLLERSSESELTLRINRRLGALRAPWRLRVGARRDGARRDGARRERSDTASPEPWTEIALEDLALGHRQILLNLETPELAPACALLPARPAAAAFTVLDVLLHRLDLEERVRARILAAFAREAVAESAEAGAP